MNSLHISALKGAAALVVATVLGCGPKDGNREFELGKAAYELRDLKKAEKMLETSVQLSPLDVDRLLYLARIRLDLGELSSARDLVAQAFDISDGDADVVLFGAQLAWHMKDYRTAAKDFTAVADNPKLDAAMRSQALAGLGVVEMTCGNDHLARIALMKAIRLDRRNAAAWYHLGLLYRQLGYSEYALEQFEVFVRLETVASPRTQKVQRSIIPALKETIAQALADRPGAAKRESSASAALLAKAETAWRKGNYKMARQHYQDAVAVDALSYPAAIGLAKAWLKTDATKAGRTRAFECYRNACVLRPSAISTFITTGKLAAELGFHAQAVQIFSRAIAASPTSLEALDGLIRALRRVGGNATVAQAYQAYRDFLSARKK